MAGWLEDAPRIYRAALFGPMAWGVILSLVRVALLLEGGRDLAVFEHLLAIAPELMLWWSLGGVLVVGTRYCPARWRGAVVTTVTVTGGLWALLSAVELGYYATTGSRATPGLVQYILDDPLAALPFLLEALSPAHFAGFALWVSLVALALGAGRSPLNPMVRPTVWSSWAALSLLGLLASWQDPAAPLREPARSLRLVLFQAMDTVPDRLPEGRADHDALRRLHLRPEPGGPRPNLLFIILESTGWYATSLGDPALGTTPTLARLAAEGWSAERFYTHIPHTSKALASIFCGRPPDPTGTVSELMPGTLQDCLPDLLRPLGYRSLHLQSAVRTFEDRQAMVAALGFDQGLYAEDVGAGWELDYFLGVDDRALLAPAFAWAEATPSPWLLSVLTVGTHYPYVLAPDLERRGYRGRTSSQADYLEAVWRQDRWLEALLAGFASRGLTRNTLVVIVGDHGEAFGEHGRQQHDQVMWEEGLRVPFVLWSPGLLPQPRRRVGARQHMDILPTILDLLQVELAEGTLPGTSLLHPPPDRKLAFFCWFSAKCLAVLEGEQRVVDHFHGEVDAYDLAADPREEKDIADDLHAASLEATVAWGRRQYVDLLATYEARRTAHGSTPRP